MQIPLRVYSSDGKLIGEFGEKKRIPVPLEDIPKTLINAVLDTEDQRFFEHRGVDFFGLVRAGMAFMTTGKKSQGASTITMQVARNFFLNREKTFTRKLNEILLALRIDKNFSKHDILELYLNKIYFGNRAYGVAAAAKIYYGKSLKELTIAEMATIAGLPQAPSRDNPIANPRAAKERRNHVLERMVENGHVGQKECAAAIAAPIDTNFHETKTQLSVPHVAEMVRNAIVAQYGDTSYEAGISVYTTVDSRLQLAANKALTDGLLAYDQRHGYKRSKQGSDAEGAILAMNPKNGAILALNGGFSYGTSNFNRVTQAERQTGSAFKTFIYAAALEKGLTLATIINDAPVVLFDYSTNSLWRPQNLSKTFYGPISLRAALVYSRNLASIKLLQQIGIDYAVKFINNFGLTGSKEVPMTPSLALGAGSTTPLKLTVAYAVFANGGYKIEPYFIDKITLIDRSNAACNKERVVFQATPKQASDTPKTPSTAPRVIKASTAYLITDTLKGAIDYGTGRGAKALGRDDLSGKTGSTNNYMDGWFVGYNGDLITTVWLGFDHPKTTYEQGAQSALPIWIQFMKTALEGTPSSILRRPEEIVTVRIDPTTGLLADPEQENAIFELFTQETAPTTLSSDNVQLTDQSTESHEQNEETLF